MNAEQTKNVIEMDNGANKEFTKKFGIWLGLFNRNQNLNISVKQGLKMEELVDLFERTTRAMVIVHNCVEEKIGKLPTKSTKARAYDALNLPKIDNQVYNFIKYHPGLSRTDIADSSGIRIQTVCGAVNRLISANMIYVDGEKVDVDSKHKVETLSIGGL